MTITESSNAPLIVVGGATGKQGSSVIRELQSSDLAYRIRALTRDPLKPKALELKKMGCQVISIDIKAGAMEEIAQAYKGADAVFVSIYTRRNRRGTFFLTLILLNFAL